MLNLLATKIDGLEIAYIAVGILLGIAIIAAFIAQIVIAIGYWRGNRTNNSLGLSGGEYARKLLDQNGMPDVQVKNAVLYEPFYSETIIVSPKELFIFVCARSINPVLQLWRWLRKKLRLPNNTETAMPK